MLGPWWWSFLVKCTILGTLDHPSQGTLDRKSVLLDRNMGIFPDLTGQEAQIAVLRASFHGGPVNLSTQLEMLNMFHSLLQRNDQ